MMRFQGELPAEVQNHILKNAKIGTSNYSASLELVAREIEAQADPQTTVSLMIETIDKKVQHLTQRCLTANRSLRSQMRF